MSGTTDIRDVVREKYGAVAKSAASGEDCCAEGSGCGCGCQAGTTETLASLGYTEEQAKAIPQGANLGLGCGNPLAHAQIRFGETVLDLGSGAGIDAFLAAREVGSSGRVIGVDMTPAMLSRARENAAKGGFANVEFRLGEIEHLPVADATVDVIISNCVINLSPEKPRVFREAWRALRPGGRMVVSDIVLTRDLPEAVRKSVEAYVGCVSGAALKADYLRLVGEAGFEDVEVVEEKSYEAGRGLLPEVVTEAGAWDAVRSVKVRARKPKK
ncbi:MAG TPA: arsenite methyltransferase [Candidatus Eisenbacteria bacterium]|nr:arsenite methyltransferase [Candidatus Eisenbacteria bacterium]